MKRTTRRKEFIRIKKHFFKDIDTKFKGVKDKRHQSIDIDPVRKSRIIKETEVLLLLLFK